MESNKEHYRHIMLYYYKKGVNATKTQRKICAVYGEDAVNDRTCQKWFAKFRNGDYSLDDAPRSGRPLEVPSEQIEELIKANPHATTREIAKTLGVSQASVKNYLHQLGYVKSNNTDDEVNKRKSSWHATNNNSTKSLETMVEREAKKMKRTMEEDGNYDNVEENEMTKNEK